MFLLPQSIIAFDNLIGFENYARGKTGSDYIGQFFTNSLIGDCLNSLMSLNDLGQLSNNYISPIIEDNLISPPVSNLIANLELEAAVAVGGTALVAAINPLVGVGIAAIIAAAQALQMIDVCVNTYVIQPHEYYNRDVLGLKCSGSSPNINFAATATKSVATQTDIPYYFSCDKTYDPTQGQDPNEGQHPNIGVGWGYNQALCTGSILANASNLQSNVGKIKVEIFPGLKRIFYNVQNCDGFLGGLKCAANAITLDNTPFTPCDTNSRYSVTLSGGEIKRLKDPNDNSHSNVSNIYAYAYFHISDNYTKYQYPSTSSSPNTAQVQMCAIAYVGASATVPTMWPIKIGCTMVAPPQDVSKLDPFFANFASGTRCQYLTSGRTDLLSLGKNLNSTDASGQDSTAIAKFLQSDMHMFSTGIGCIQDLLTKFILQPANGQGKSFFEIFQSQLRNIVLAALMLAVALFGIKIIASAEPLKHGEYLMWGVKISLVIAFALGNMWYSTSSNSSSLFSAIINTSNTIGGYFLSAAQNDDPIGHCRYDYNGQLLKERLITSSPGGGSLVYTEGYSGVKISIWDFIDCKLINYLNFGSCQYNWYGLIFGIIASLGFPFGMFLGGGYKFLLAISSGVFAFMFVLLIIRFALITIVSLFTLTILTLLSPIFICFALFEATKGIFKGWFDMVLGYMLYPGLLFAFMALMLATFDSVFYGDISDIKSSGDIVAYCKDKPSSMYCATVNSLSQDSCMASKNSVNITAQFTDTITVPVLGWQFKTLKTSIAEKYGEALKRLLLFATLFWLLHSSIFGSMAVMLNVPPISPGGAFEKNYFSTMMAPSQMAAGAAAKGAAAVGLRTAGTAKRGASNLASRMRR